MQAPTHPSASVRYFPGPLGLLSFTCASLHAVLQPASCAAQFRRNREGSACQRCPTGAAHAGAHTEAIAARSEACIRCGEGGRRLIGECLCIPCSNRAREVIIGRNAKGATPRVWATRLYVAHAVVGAPESSGAAMLDIYGGRARRAETCVVPLWSRIDGGHLWVEWLTTGPDELRDLVARRVPGGRLLDYELGPPSVRFTAPTPCQR